MINTNKKIIIIDSGIGGLCIFKINIINKNNCIYIMDNRGFPYGNKNYIYIAKRLLNIINYIKKKYYILFIIIACNTASIICLKYIKKKFFFPIIGIFPNIKKALKITKNNIIILLGTYITINSNYIYKYIKNILNKKIVKIYSSILVKKSEKKIKYNKKIKINKIITNKINKYKYADTIILGCTHFYFLKNEIKKIFNKKIYCIEYLNEIKKKINKYINIKNKNNKKYFFYTKKENFNKIFIKNIKKKYNFTKIKNLNI